MKTIRGIYIDIMESDYVAKIGCYSFYFSSDKYREKFENTIDEYCNNENKKLELKLAINIDFTELLIFQLYQSIEKRGFRVERDSKVMRKPPLFQIISVI